MLQIKHRKSLEALLQAKKAMSKDEMRMYVGGGKNQPCVTPMDMSIMPEGGGGSSKSSSSSHNLDEVLVVEHFRSKPIRIIDYTSYLDTFYRNLYDYGSQHIHKDSSSSAGGSSNNFVGVMGNSKTNQNNIPPAPPLPMEAFIDRKKLEEMKKSMDPNLYKFIEKLWESGMLQKNPDPSVNNYPAYYDSEKNILYITNPDFASEHTLAHEYAHYLQDQNNALAPAGSDIGDFNNEMQADILATIYSYAFQGNFMSNVWMSSKTKDNLAKNLGKDSKGNISVEDNLWNHLNDNSFMLQLQDEWRTYHEEHPTSSPTNLAGEKRDWNYNWQYYFDKLGIKHP